MWKTLEKIKNLLEKEFGSKAKAYMIDDPNLVPMSSLPCFAVTPATTDIDVADTGRDLYTFSIDIFLILNAIEELGKIERQIIGTKFLVDIMEGEETAGNLKTDTVISLLRRNLRLGDNWNIENVSSINYGLRIRPEQKITKEASCRITVRKLRVRS